MSQPSKKMLMEPVGPAADQELREPDQPAADVDDELRETDGTK